MDRAYAGVEGAEVTDQGSFSFGGERRRWLLDLRAEIDAELDRGGMTCRACGQLARSYNRKLNSSMAAALCWLTRQSGDGTPWIDTVSWDVPEYVRRSRELPRLKLWGLAEPKPVEPGSKKKTSGFWRITDKGRDFALGKVNVPSHARVWLDSVRENGFSEDRISVQDALGRHFDYRELMGEWAYPENLNT